MIKEILEEIDESAVGAVGRTGKQDAKQFVLDNPDLIKKFKSIVSDIGGKAVAAEILNLNLFGKPSKRPTTNYTKQKHPGEE